MRAANFESHPEPQDVLNPFDMKSLPSENQLNLWKDGLTGNNCVVGQWQYFETSFGRLDLNTLLKLHTAKGIKSAVEQEINWLSSIYSKPQTVSQHLPASCQMLYLNGYDQICQLHGMSANELAKICVNR